MDFVRVRVGPSKGVVEVEGRVTSEDSHPRPGKIKSPEYGRERVYGSQHVRDPMVKSEV